MGAVPQARTVVRGWRDRLGRRVWWLGLALSLALLLAAPAAMAVPGGPSGIDESDMAAWLQELSASGGQIPTPSGGVFGTLNTSGVNSDSATQVNDPSLDNFQVFPGSPPLVNATESETSVAASGQDIVVAYNSSAGIRFASPFSLAQHLRSGYSVSHDGGETWQSGFVPPSPDSIINGVSWTIGDPVLGSDRAGNIYYVTLNYPGLQVDKSTDGGRTWSATTIASVWAPSGYPLPDKEWLAIGPDPQTPSQDDLYVTWTQYISNSAQLWMSRSTDGDATWSSPQVVYAPVASGVMSNQIQYTNPVVDPSTGRLYIPFLHFSTVDADDVQVLASDDGGQSFQFLKFNVPGAPSATTFPNVSPGSLTDCGIYGGIRLTMHQGTATVGRHGLPRWVQATRIISQPATAATAGRLFIAINSSTSPTYGAGTGSVIRLLYSPDGGTTWAPPVTVAPSTTSEPQHFHPAITVDSTGSQVRVVYYAQNASGRISVESAVGTVANGGVSFGIPSQIASPFDLPPTNITISRSATLNYDASTPPCYGLGEYLSATQTSAGPAAAWGGDRQLWKEPPGAIISGVHPQEDVFFSPLP